MLKCVRKTITLSVATLVLTSISAFAYDGKKDAIDGGMTYPRADGTYTAYKYNDQKSRSN